MVDMRVLIVVPDKPLAGGVEGYYRKLDRHFTFEADFFPVGRARDDGGASGELLRLGGKVLAFLSRLARRRPDVVLLNPSLEARSLLRDLLFLVLARAAGRRCIVFFRGWQPEMEERIGRRHRDLVRRVLDRADALVVLAEQFRRTLRSWGVSRPVCVESTAVEWPRDADAVLKARAGRTDGPLRLLFVARLIKSKGLSEAIDTVRILRERGHEVELMVCGDGPELQPARRDVEARGIGGIRFLGYLRGAEKEAAFLEADLLFLPTRHGEGMPNAVLEAMAYGLPVVTRAIGGVVDFFEDGRMGAITTSTDPMELADLVERFLEPEPRLAAGRVNMSFARRFFTAPAVARRLELLIRNVAAAGGDRRDRSWREAEGMAPLSICENAERAPCRAGGPSDLSNALPGRRRRQTMHWPDLYILGAPKSGTTALALYLSEHPKIAFSKIKEPHFFATDLPRQRVVTSATDYLDLFAAGKPDARIRAEASVWYLYSREAVVRILDVRPDARFVVMLRNPVDAVHALHQQKIQSADEDVLDFERAFKLQEARRRGKSVPPSCREPSTLLYGDVYRYASQIERLRQRVPAEQVRIYLYEDFARDPGAVYRDVLAFVGLADDGRTSFPRVNESRRPRSIFLNRMIRRPSPMRRRLSALLRRYLDKRGIRISTLLKRINTRVAPRPPLATGLREELSRYFASDVRRLEKLLGRNLSAWLPERGDNPSSLKVRSMGASLADRPAATSRDSDADAALPVTIYLSRLSGNGAEHMMVKLANQFVADGLEVTMIVSERGGPLEDRLTPEIELLSLDAGHSLTATVRLAHILRRRCPPVVLSALTYPNISAVIAARLAGGRTRVVVSERNTTSRWLANRGHLRAALEARFLRAAYRRADGVVAVSQGVADDLSAILGGAGPPIDVVHNPTVDERTQGAAAQAPDHPFLTEPGPPVVVAAGRFTRQKDFPVLIRAFARLRDARDARLLLLGEGPERAALERLVADLGLAEAVAMPGYVANPLAAFGRARLFVLSSRFEGFPNVLVEALLTGVPVVSTDCRSGPREILDGGRYGRLVPVGDVEALAEAMAGALDDPGCAALRTGRALLFSAAAAAGRYREILHRAAHQPRASDGRPGRRAPVRVATADLLKGL